MFDENANDATGADDLRECAPTAWTARDYASHRLSNNAIQMQSNRAPSPPNDLVLFAQWEGSLDELRSRIDGASDWGPFELLQATPAPTEQNSIRTVRCDFLYHGREPDRARFESNLFDLLRSFATWTHGKRAHQNA